MFRLINTSNNTFYSSAEYIGRKPTWFLKSRTSLDALLEPLPLWRLTTYINVVPHS